MKRLALAAALALGSYTAALHAGENDWFVPLGLPPVAAPQRISGGESFPPLPLPATPLRRSERKREPAPPRLAGKVIWGESATFTYESGLTRDISDWNLCPADIQQLVRKASGHLGVPYATDTVTLGSFHGDPELMPALFFSGVRTVRFSDDQLAALRDYVLRGGMLVCDSIAGSPYFTASMREAMLRAFPDSVFRLVPADHPLYRLVHEIDRVKFPRNLDANRPHMEAIYIGSRIGVLLSPYGLGCGWDDREVPLLKQAVFYDVNSSVRLGVNLIAYIVGYAEAARMEARPELFGALDEKTPTDEFVFAQLRHAGAWNTHPGAAAALLRRLNRATSLRASLKRVVVDPARDSLAPYPFLFLSGLDDFELSEPEVAALRGVLNGAGTLLINNGLGLRTFDAAVRRELQRVLPEARLEPIPPNHPIFRGAFAIDRVDYTPGTDAGPAPRLEGITLNGDLRVIYSPFDVEGGWLGCDYPGSRGYQPESAMQVGINIILYAMTH